MFSAHDKLDSLNANDDTLHLTVCYYISFIDLPATKLEYKEVCPVQRMLFIIAAIVLYSRL